VIFSIMHRLILPALLLIASSALAGDLSGRAAKVHDGDTISLESGETIRLWGIDAPELEQSCTDQDDQLYACGERAKLAAKLLIGDQPVTCRQQDIDHGGQIVAQCATSAGADLGAMLVITGWAVDDGQSSDGWYAPYQDQARERHAGLWAGTFQMPSERTP
jgi:endonuclease YncB( thermonuclease family)